MKFGSDIHGPKRKNCKNFDSLISAIIRPKFLLVRYFAASSCTLIVFDTNYQMLTC